MSQNVVISQNYIMKLILKKLLVQVGSFMMWWNDNDFWPTDGYRHLLYEFCLLSVCQIKQAANMQAPRQAWEGGQNSKDFFKISTLTIWQKDFVR